jgi:MFS family permease
MCIAGSFIIFPHVTDESHQWNWWSLVGVYTLHGVGRATFEGTLKSTFADYFAYEKEGAFANIILQNGLSSALGFALTFLLHCSARKQKLLGPYCVLNKDGSVHDVLTFVVIIVVTAFLAIFGYHRASTIRSNEVSRMQYENIPTTIV